MKDERNSKSQTDDSGSHVIARPAIATDLTSKPSNQDRAFRRLVEIISAVPAHTRSEIVRLSLTDRKHADVETRHIVKELRSALEAFVPIDELPRLTFEADELNDTQNEVEVAFAIDRILQRWLTEGAD